jgi:hypothetical protein
MDTLIEKFPELKKAYKWDEDANAFVLDSKEVEKALQAEKESYSAYRAAMSAAEAKVDIDQAKDALKQAKKSIWKSVDQDTLRVTDTNYEIKTKEHQNVTHTWKEVDEDKVENAINAFAQKNGGLSTVELQMAANDFAKANLGWTDEEISKNIDSLLEYVEKIYAAEKELNDIELASARGYATSNADAIETALAPYVDANTSSQEKQFLITQTAKT